MNIKQISEVLNDERAAFRLFERIIWPDGNPVCPHCGNPDGKPQYDLSKTRPGLRKCGACRKQYTARVGTIFEDSHIALGAWLVAIHRMCSSKKGISAAQLQRELGISYKSSWFMCHRIRLAMTQPPLSDKLGGPGTSGIVEVDETFVGGKYENNPHKGYKHKAKAIVMTLVERDGRARAIPIKRREKSHMQWPIRENVDGSAHIMTDKHKSYVGIDQHFASHGAVDHGAKEFVRGILHVNFAESYHSLLKRGIVGTFHHISEEHLPKYLAEFSFRWNTRKEADSTRADLAIAGSRGKRLMYRDAKAKKPTV